MDANKTAPVSAATSTAPAPNGSVKPPRKTPVPRETPVVAVQFTKEEYAEVKAALTKLMQGIEMDVSLAPFVRALVLKQLRGTATLATK